MDLDLPQLEYGYDELEPVFSRQALKIHHRVHHQGYLNKVRRLVSGGPLEDKDLEVILRHSMRDTTQCALFNNAAQAWNHAFFWQSMSSVPSTPTGEFAQQIDCDFGGLEQLRLELKHLASRLFGNGWVWLVMEDHCLRVVSTANAALPYCYGQTPLLALDVWEHAYYLDHLNRRQDYIDALVDRFINWRFADQNFEQCEENHPCAIH